MSEKKPSEKIPIAWGFSKFLMSDFLKTLYKTVRQKITWSGTQLFTESRMFSNVPKSATNLLNANL